LFIVKPVSAWFSAGVILTVWLWELVVSALISSGRANEGLRGFMCISEKALAPDN
jgi:hypothetical protein